LDRKLKIREKLKIFKDETETIVFISFIIIIALIVLILLAA